MRGNFGRAAAALGFVVAVLALGAPAGATTIGVTDEATYRAAVIALSADNSGPHVISVDAGFTITNAGDPVYTGTQPLTIRGNGNTITAGVAGTRLLVHAPDTALRIEDLTVDGFSGAGGGGAVLHAGTGDVTITGSTFTGNSSSTGGAVLINEGDTTITGSTFSQNTTSSAGGAILSADGDTSVTDSDFAGNEAVSAGGAILTANGEVTILRSTFTDNGADAGGAVLTSGGTTTITEAGFTENDADTAGAVLTNGETTITATTFDRNEADDAGALLVSGGDLGAIDAAFTGNEAAGVGGAVLVSGGDATLERTTLAGNTADSAGSAVVADALTATNSTITDNTSSVSAVFGQAIDLTHVTLASNDSDVASIIGDTLTAFGSVLADPIGGPNCEVNTTTSAGHNRSADASCGLTGPTDEEDVGDPGLEALGDFGGLTPTRPPVEGSLLVDAIPEADCAPAVPTDQRGEARPGDGDLDGTLGCDIGAVELPGALPEPPPVPDTGPIAARPGFTG